MEGNKKNKSKIIVIVIIIISIGSITISKIVESQRILKYENQYENLAEELAKKYDLDDAYIGLINQGWYKKYRSYLLKIDSNRLSNLTKQKLYNFVKEFESINVYDAQFIVLTEINSNGSKYYIDKIDDYILKKDFEKIFEDRENKAKVDKDSLEYKVRIYKWVENRYDYYDEKEGGYAGDKYSDTILDEAAEKFEVSSEFVFTKVWTNHEVIEATNK